MKFDNIFSQKILRYALLTTIGLCSTELASAACNNTQGTYNIQATVCLEQVTIPTYTISGFFGLQPGACTSHTFANTNGTVCVSGVFNKVACSATINLPFMLAKRSTSSNVTAMNQLNIIIDANPCKLELAPITGTAPSAVAPPLSNPIYQPQPGSDNGP